MFRLIYSSDYTEYAVDTFPCVDDAARYCQTHYEVDRVKFGQDDAGVLYTALYGEEGIVVLRLEETTTEGERDRD